MTIIIKGRPIVKKNSKRMIRAGKRMIPISSKAYLAWEKEALWQLKGKEPLADQTDIQIVFHMKGKLDADLDNLVTSLLDVLQKAKIIKNDKTITHIDAYKEPGADDWWTEIR